MTKENVSNAVNNVKLFLAKRSPEILTGMGIAGMVTTTVLAVKATPKALVLIQEEKNRQDYILAKEARDHGHSSCPVVEHLKPIDLVKVAWKPYIPAMITGSLSVACLIGASSVHGRRNAALATAYKLSETAFNEFREKTIETVGPKKVKEIKENIAKDKLEKNPVSKNEVIITPKGNTLCLESVSGRYFRSDIETIKKVVNQLNRQMITENYISLTEFYSELGLPPTKISDDIGWNLSKGMIELDFSSLIADDGTPCIVVDYMYAPVYDFNKYW